MMRASLRLSAIVLVVCVLACVAPLAAQQPGKAPAAPAKPPTLGSAMDNLRWREIGPAIMGGRIDDFAVVESNPSIAYVATASGGVWKTTNGGTTWQPVFDNESVSTIGDVTVAPSDPSIVWVGTGEPNNRQSSSWGNGVYKSTDSGRTWTNMGLGSTHHIARIQIHPTNPNTVYVAAVGRLWGASRERGVYKTTDGGKNWAQVLFVNEDTGVVDLAMDWESPDTLYAAAYQRRRTVFGFNGSGPHSAIHKTTDGGANWKKLSSGLPYEQGAGETGRIGVQVYRRNPNIVYALVEHKSGGTFRSTDKGETWTKMSDVNPRPMYYSKIHIDPNNDLRIWALGAPLYFSEDGGKTFRTMPTRVHGDYHALWINPANSNHMIIGSDGGINVSGDGGATWEYVNTVALGQFYEIGVDMRKPYYICGGLQDNGAWCGPSRTLFQQGITNEDWYRVGGGDGYYAMIDPTDPNIVYSESQDGNLNRRDMRSTESKSIRPRESGEGPRYRFQWNSPFAISAHDPRTVYYGGNLLFKSTDRGDTWEKISPDLTSGTERDKLPIMGKVPDGETMSRHDGVQQWPTITSINESPRSPNVLWAGTDDGNLQVTRDGGKNWKNVMDRLPGVPKNAWMYVSRVIASKHADGRAYVTLDGHRQNDFGIYVFVTEDYGESWKSISSGIASNNGVVNVIREHPRNANLLFAGTEYGAFASFDRGSSWTAMKQNLPTVPVDDIAIHPRDNDLIFGTHGRAIWVLDDITPIEQLDSGVLNSDVHLFDIRPATAWRIYGHKGNTGYKMFVAPNPPYGALIHFYLKAKPAENDRVRITISDAAGKTVRELTCGGPAPTPPAGGPGGGGFGGGGGQPRCEPQAGINRINWDLRMTAPNPPGPGGPGGGGGGFGGGGQGPSVEPGEYTVKVAFGGKEVSKKVAVEEDPRIQISAADRAARRQAIDRLYELSRNAGRTQRAITGLRTALNTAVESWKRPGGPQVPDDVKKMAEDLLKQAEQACLNYATRQQCLGAAGEGLGNAGPPLVFQMPPIPTRIGQLLNAIDGFTAAPTSWQREEIEAVAKKLADTAPAANKLVEQDLPALNKKMNDAGVPHLRVPGPPRGGQQPGM